MSKSWLRGHDQKRAKREQQVRQDAREKFGVRLSVEDVRRLAHEIMAGEHGPPTSEHHRQQLVRCYRVELPGAAEMAYARLLVESEEIAGLLTREEWLALLARRAEGQGRR